MNTKTIFWTLGGIATVVGGYFIYKRVTQPTEFIGVFDDNLGSETTTNTNTNTSSNDGLPLKRGSKGDKVTQLQKFLVSEGYSIGSFGILSDGVDGDFGGMTETAVRENQKPFATFKSMYPTAVEGEVSADFFNSNIKGRF